MQRFDHKFVAMGGPCRFRIDCADEGRARLAIKAAEAEVRRLEACYSRYRPDSLVSEINRGAGLPHSVSIDSETVALLRYADTLWRESDGLFDLTSGVLRRGWDFRSGRLPSPADIERLLSLVGWQRVEWDEQQIRLPEAGMELDFGGCVKEYACDSAARVLAHQGIAHALVDLAGDMAGLGGQGCGQSPGEPWQIGVRNPGGGTRPIAHIPLVTGCLASSGSYERCMEVDGRRYGHILSPKTGWPVEGLVAVSVVAPQCLVAGSAATVAMLKPADEAQLWLQELGLPWLAVDAELRVAGTLSSGP